MDAPPPWVAPLPAAEADYVVEIFRAACIQGSVLFRKGEAEAIQWKDAHPDLRWWYPFDKTQRVYKINTVRMTYLVTSERNPRSSDPIKMCAVVARDISVLPTLEKVLKVKFSREGRRNLVTGTRNDSIVFALPQEGRKLTISRLYSPFVAIEATEMSAAEIRNWKSSRAGKTAPLLERTAK